MGRSDFLGGESRSLRSLLVSVSGGSLALASLGFRLTTFGQCSALSLSLGFERLDVLVAATFDVGVLLRAPDQLSLEKLMFFLARMRERNKSKGEDGEDRCEAHVGQKRKDRIERESLGRKKRIL